MVELSITLRSILVDDVFGAGDAPTREVCLHPPASGSDSVSPTF